MMPSPDQLWQERGRAGKATPPVSIATPGIMMYS
jgi:hypothetical protein